MYLENKFNIYTTMARVIPTEDICTHHMYDNVLCAIIIFMLGYWFNARLNN